MQAPRQAPMGDAVLAERSGCGRETLVRPHPPPRRLCCECHTRNVIGSVQHSLRRGAAPQPGAPDARQRRSHSQLTAPRRSRTPASSVPGPGGGTAIAQQRLPARRWHPASVSAPLTSSAGGRGPAQLRVRLHLA